MGREGRFRVRIRHLTACTIVASVVVLTAAPVLNEPLTGRQVFPLNNWWNEDITTAPIDARSAQLIDWISGRTATNPAAVRRLHPDFGPPPYGFPYVVVSGDQPRVPLTFVAYGNESDAGAPGLPGLSDPGGGQDAGPLHRRGRSRWRHVRRSAPARHRSRSMAAVRVVRDVLESRRVRAGRRIRAPSSTSATNDRRPDGWTSADAAGLAIFPGLIRYDEVFGAGEITHAFRVTTRATNGYVWPASHAAGTNASAPPMGARLRLKASHDISGFAPEVQKIFRAMKRYGLIVADNGSDMYISGTMDARWNNDVLNPAFGALTADDFEVVQLGWKSAGLRPPTNLRIIK